MIFGTETELVLNAAAVRVGSLCGGRLGQQRARRGQHHRPDRHVMRNTHGQPSHNQTTEPTPVGSGNRSHNGSTVPVRRLRVMLLILSSNASVRWGRCRQSRPTCYLSPGQPTMTASERYRGRPNSHLSLDAIPSHR
jgi:hypothetical protein